MKENIEVEVRSFVTKEKYDELLDFFRGDATLIKEDEQETHYFSGENDLRIQKGDLKSKIWLKKGKIHDDCREEIEINFNKEDFPKLGELFSSLGFEIDIKWFRRRFQFDWEGIKVCLDYTRGYGYIIELEKLTSNDEKEKEQILNELRQKMDELGIKMTSKEEFNNKFEHYRNNWRELIA